MIPKSLEAETKKHSNNRPAACNQQLCPEHISCNELYDTNVCVKENLHNDYCVQK